MKRKSKVRIGRLLLVIVLTLGIVLIGGFTAYKFFKGDNNDMTNDNKPSEVEKPNKDNEQGDTPIDNSDEAKLRKEYYFIDAT